MKKLNMSREDYLEAILISLNRLGACRVTDVAERLGVTKASTSVAISNLEAEGYVRKDDWRILLTDTGRAIAQQMFERHVFFTDWFQSLGVDPETASEDACMIEHVLSTQTYDKIKAYVCEKSEQELGKTDKD